MLQLVHLMLPELFLTVVACALFLLGVSTQASHRRLAAMVALAAVAVVFAYEFVQIFYGSGSGAADTDPWHTVRVGGLAHYIKMLSAGVGCLLILLAWPTNENATGNGGINYGSECGEFFGLMLLSLAGIFLVADANDIILLFLGIELASLPTYIMVSVSRPTPVAQEAGVKYFFLGAMAAAVMLFGFSYLYGSTGQTRLDQIAVALDAAHHTPVGLTPWMMLAIVLLICGFCFKIAAVPMHFYAGDVYQGAATPVTAFLSFVPKTSGFVALIKLLGVAGAEVHPLPERIVNLLSILAVLTMFFGNVLGLMQYNVKRLLAYSSIAHTGYMLVGLTVLAGASTDRIEGLQGVLFYLAAYGVVNTAAFGVLILLPSRTARMAGRMSPSLADSAETFEDLAGQGRKHVGLGLAMAVACFSLIGIPLTVGFFGKFMLIMPALHAHFYWLVAFVAVNAAISCAYYLRIVGTLFLRPEPADDAGGLPIVAPGEPVPSPLAGVSAFAARFQVPLPTVAAIVLSVVGTLLLGTILPATDLLRSQANAGANLQTAPNKPPIPTAKAPAPLTAADARN